MSILDFLPATRAIEPIAPLGEAAIVLDPLTNIAGMPATDADRTVPFLMPSAQAYYWSAEWQADVRETLAALENGEFVDFTGGDDHLDVARWLLSADD
jgi:predicted transcriptional regulator